MILRIALLLLSLALLVLPGAAEGGGPLFEPFVLYELTGGNTAAAAIGHLSDDDLPDIAVASDCGGGSCAFWILAQRIDGSFAVSHTFTLEDQQSVAIGDLDTNGTDDLVVPLFSTVAVLFQESPGVFASPVELPVTPTALRVLAGDFSDDGLDDAVSIPFGTGGNETDVVELYSQEQDGTLAYSVYQLDHSGFEDLEEGDFNGDGRLDVVVVDQSGTAGVGVLRQINSGFDDATYHDPGGDGGYSCVAVGDVTGDGRDDIVVALTVAQVDYVGILIQTSEGALAVGPLSPILSNGPYSCEAADLDFDGYSDLALYASAAVEVLLGTPSGTFNPQGWYAVPPGNAHSHSLRLSDLDGDGSFDAVLAGDNGGLVILRGRSRRLFEDGFESGDTSAWSSAVP